MDGPTDQPTDRPTDQPTDTPSYRYGWTHLKIRTCFSLGVRRSLTITIKLLPLLYIYYEAYVSSTCCLLSLIVARDSPHFLNHQRPTLFMVFTLNQLSSPSTNSLHPQPTLFTLNRPSSPSTKPLHPQPTRCTQLTFCPSQAPSSSLSTS